MRSSTMKSLIREQFSNPILPSELKQSDDIREMLISLSFGWDLLTVIGTQTMISVQSMTYDK